MDFKINIVAEDEQFALQQSKNLKNWIEDDELESVKVKQERKELEEDDAGGGLLAALQVIGGAALEPNRQNITSLDARKNIKDYY